MTKSNENLSLTAQETAIQQAMHGMDWSIKMAKIVSCTEFQNQETGQMYYTVKMAYFGGFQKLSLSQADYNRFKAFDQMAVRANGTMIIEETKYGQKVTMKVLDIQKI